MKSNMTKGSRTPQGKARSSMNAFKHGANSRRILPEEAKLAAKFEKAFSAELHAQGLLESEIIGDLVVNRLQRRRIEAATTDQFQEAWKRAVVTDLEAAVSRREKAFLRWAKFYGRILRGYRDCLPAWLCGVFLGHFKDWMAGDPSSSEQVENFLKFIYGEDLVNGGGMILLEFNRMKATKDLPAFADQQREVEKLRASLFDTIQEAIKYQKDLTKAEATEENEDSERLADSVVLPEGETLDLLHRYSAANMREFSHLLQSLEQVRRLRSGG